MGLPHTGPVPGEARNTAAEQPEKRSAPQDPQHEYVIHKLNDDRRSEIHRRRPGVLDEAMRAREEFRIDIRRETTDTRSPQYGGALSIGR